MMECYLAVKKEGNLTFCDYLGGHEEYYANCNKLLR